MSVELSIVMPCLNEAETIGACVQKAFHFLRASGIRGEVVIGDNGSADGSQAIAARLGARVINVALRGYGAALYAAVAASRGSYCIMGDSDDSYDFGSLDLFVRKLREGNDLVMGNRFKGGIKESAMPWKNRYIGNPILSFIGRTLFSAKVRDFHCGLRGFSRAAFDRMELRTTGMEFASEMVIKATLLHMRITEVPTTLSPDGRSRPPHLRPYRDGWRHLRFMLLFSPNWLFLFPGLALTLIGALLGGVLLWHPLQLGSVRLGLDTLVYCSTMVVSGFQAVLFSGLSRSYIERQGLYPSSLKTNRYNPLFSLERGLIAGLFLCLTGAVVAFRAIWVWRQHDFGALEIERIQRLVLPSSLAVSLGIELMLFSFMMSVLALHVRPQLEYTEASETDHRQDASPSFI